MSTTLRPYRPEDRAFVLSLAPRFAEIPPPLAVELADIPAGADRFLRRAVDDTDGAATILIAECGGQAAGVIVLWVQPTAYEELPIAYISEIAVAADYEGQGVAQALLAGAIAWAEEKGLPRISLRVFSSNRRALKAYRRAGFAIETHAMVKVLNAHSDLPREPALDRLRRIMQRLRTPNGGCAWDLAQTFETIAPYTIEEAYEVAEAIASGSRTELCDELGDLLLQVVFHARMAEEEGTFDLDDVADAINEKMIRRHPHVFGAADARDSAGQTRAWEAMKAAERAERAAVRGERPSALDGVGTALPALTRAVKLQGRAARVGFDWTTTPPIFEKLSEEVAELQAELAAPTPDPARVADEVGDLLFVAANLARRLGIDPEAALRAGNAKFERRFRRMEALSPEGLERLDLDQQEALWSQAKREERRD